MTNLNQRQTDDRMFVYAVDKIKECLKKSLRREHIKTRFIQILKSKNDITVRIIVSFGIT